MSSTHGEKPGHGEKINDHNYRRKVWNALESTYRRAGKSPIDVKFMWEETAFKGYAPYLPTMRQNILQLVDIYKKANRGFEYSYIGLPTDHSAKELELKVWNQNG